MRTFFGLELPGGLAMEIADWRDRQFGPLARPVPPANFHITLAFIGELEPPAMERLYLATEAWLAVSTPPAAELALDCTGYWPRPGIYWLGARTWPESLAQLANKLRQLATTAGARRDRNPFQPHVTLFRNCTTAPAAPSVVPPLPLPYRHFALFESRRGRTGVSYHPQQQWELAPATA
jgi:2'-5' RNA ligase